MKSVCTLAAVALLALPAGAHGQSALDGRTIRLWPEGVPDARPAGGGPRLVDGRVENVHDPTLTYGAPTGTATGTAVSVCPGGSYARLAIANEAAGVDSSVTNRRLTIDERLDPTPRR
jgi:hypothetical protein